MLKLDTMKMTYSHAYAGRPVKRSPFLEEMFRGSAE